MDQNIIEPSDFHALLQHIDNEFPETHRKRKASNADVLFYALRVLKYGIPWSEIKKTFQVDYSHIAIYKRFQNWTRRGVFYTAWCNAVCRYASEKYRNDLKAFSAVFVDCSRLKYFEVTEFSGPNSIDRGRSGTKISAICDDNRVPLGLCVSPANIPDSALLHPTIDRIPFDIQPDKRRPTHFVADKGYAAYTTSEELLKKNRRFFLIVERKKNMKRPINKKCETPAAFRMLSQRHLIENMFGIMKKDKRIRTRDDKTIAPLSFIFVSVCPSAFHEMRSV